MTYSSEILLYKKLSTAFCLALIFLASSVVGAYCLWQSSKLKELQKPLPFYISISRALGATSTDNLNF